MEMDIFADIDLMNATLHVPASALDNYRTTDQWKDFGTIIALTGDELSVSTTVLPSVSPTATHYDLYGRKLSTPQRGLNIIRMSDGTTRKILL